MPEISLKINKKLSGLWRRAALIVAIFLLAIGALVWLQNDTQQKNDISIKEPVSEKLSVDNTVDSSITPRKLKLYSGEEFVSLYNAFAYPNVKEFEIAPSITGNSIADERIRNLAIERGYIGRSIAIPPLRDTGKYQLQYRAATSWDEMVKKAKQDGQTLILTAAFRTIEDQRDLFNEGLNTAGATPALIAAGKADLGVQSVLKRISVPGYTRHHSGYTVDIGCQNDNGVLFGASTCFAWLSRNNYENAKTFGWIPSYPSGAPKQGPDPEEWEYSWVGFDVVSEPVN
jgi:LAS superfamily LD-carboxypeptidase LdcB